MSQRESKGLTMLNQGGLQCYHCTVHITSHKFTVMVPTSNYLSTKKRLQCTMQRSCQGSAADPTGLLNQDWYDTGQIYIRPTTIPLALLSLSNGTIFLEICLISLLSLWLNKLAWVRVHHRGLPWIQNASTNGLVCRISSGLLQASHTCALKFHTTSK